MIRLVAEIHNRRTMLLGLDRENTSRLHAGKPIVVDLQAMSSNVEGDLQDLVLCAGETLGDIHDELSRYIPGLPPFEEPFE